MLRLTRIHKFRIPNRLAVFAALLLVAATVAGANAGLDSTGVGVPASSMAGHQQEQAGGKNVRTLRGSKGFKASLFLFRRN